MPKIGDILGEKYRLDALIGKGGMGEVFSATQVEFGKRVAVKCLFRDAAKEEKVVRRFMREAKAAAAIGHHGIIDIYDVGEDNDGSRYLVMEYLEGEDLSGLLNQKGRIEQSFAAYILCQVLSALEAAHSAGIVHRDLKPDNVFIVETRQALPDVKLLDFGISKISDAGQKVHRLTETGIMMGTPYYMAPEQARAERDIDHRVDLYAISVVLYECVTGHLPFGAPALHALVYEILHGQVKPPRSINPEITSELEEVILRGISRDRNDRYQTANEMLLDLLPFMDKEHVGLISLPLGVTRESLKPPFDEELDALAQTVNASAPSFSSIEQPVADDTFDKTLQDDDLDETIKDERPGPVTGSETDGEALSSEMRVGDDLIDVVNDKPSVGFLSGRLGWAAAGVLGVMIVVGSLYAALSRDVTGGDVVNEGGGVTKSPYSERSSSGGVPSIRDSATSDDVITVTLRDVPDGATVYFEGARVEGTTLRRPRSAVHREVRVELAGFVPWRQMIEFSEDRDLEVQLSAFDASPRTVESDTGSTTPRNRPQKRTTPPIRGDDDRPVLLEWGQTGRPRSDDGSTSP